MHDIVSTPCISLFPASYISLHIVQPSYVCLRRKTTWTRFYAFKKYYYDVSLEFERERMAGTRIISIASSSRRTQNCRITWMTISTILPLHGVRISTYIFAIDDRLRSGLWIAGASLLSQLRYAGSDKGAFVGAGKSVSARRIIGL
jgi:hypothetical protein